MAAVNNHYEFLGLDPSASRQEITAAVERVSEQAIALVYTSPARSADLWERIREMRRDLLATPEGRQVYDEALLQPWATSPATVPVREDAVIPPPRVLPLIPLPAASEAQRTAFAPMPAEEHERVAAWPYALVAAAAIFAAVIAALFLHAAGNTPGHAPVAMNLWQTGPMHGSKIRSGGFVTLKWTRIPGATRYRVQVATAPGDPSDPKVFAHGAKTRELTASRYHLKVVGSQLYYWRVQALVHGRWRPYAASRHFAVARPSIALPVVASNLSAVAPSGQHARLCWSKVPRAVGYKVRVNRDKTVTVHHTCMTLHVHAGRYAWRVAALVKGARTYTGAYTPTSLLQIEAARAPVIALRTQHSSAPQPKPARSPRHHSSHRKQPGSATKVVEVAAVVPKSSAVTHRARPVHAATLRTTSRLASSHPAQATTKRPVLRPARHANVLPRVPATNSRASASHQSRSKSVKAVPTAARTPGRRSRAPRSSHRPTAPPSQPPPTSVPPSRNVVPPPPAPPVSSTATNPPPTAISVPTQGVTTAKAANSQPLIYVRPIVATVPPTTAPTLAPTQAVHTAPVGAVSTGAPTVHAPAHGVTPTPTNGNPVVSAPALGQPAAHSPEKHGDDSAHTPQPAFPFQPSAPAPSPHPSHPEHPTHPGKP